MISEVGSGSASVGMPLVAACVVTVTRQLAWFSQPQPSPSGSASALVQTGVPEGAAGAAGVAGAEVTGGVLVDGSLVFPA